MPDFSHELVEAITDPDLQASVSRVQPAATTRRQIAAAARK
jgi:hypothetical protein